MDGSDGNEKGERTAGDGKNLAGVRERPWLFALLIAPMALLSNGLIGGALSLLLRQQGTGLARIASIISLLTLPQTIYFLWSPVTDFWVRRRTWLMLGATALLRKGGWCQH
jgi:hypothetical protein